MSGKERVHPEYVVPAHEEAGQVHFLYTCASGI